MKTVLLIQGQGEIVQTKTLWYKKSEIIFFLTGKETMEKIIRHGVGGV